MTSFWTAFIAAIIPSNDQVSISLCFSFVCVPSECTKYLIRAKTIIVEGGEECPRMNARRVATRADVVRVCACACARVCVCVMARDSGIVKPAIQDYVYIVLSYCERCYFMK